MSVDTRTPRTPTGGRSPGFDDEPGLSSVKVPCDPAQVIVNHASFRVQLAAPAARGAMADTARIPVIRGSSAGANTPGARGVERPHRTGRHGLRHHPTPARGAQRGHRPRRRPGRGRRHDPGPAPDPPRRRCPRPDRDRPARPRRTRQPAAARRTPRGQRVQRHLTATTPTGPPTATAATPTTATTTTASRHGTATTTTPAPRGAAPTACATRTTRAAG